MREELFARKVGFFYSFGSKLGHHFRFGSNGCVIGSGNPASIFPLHSCAAHQDILNGIVEHMPHVQDSGDVGGRNYNRIRFTFIGFGVKQFVLHPVFIPFVFHLCRVVLA
ncbi:hypothetical protein SDC9_172581 [bioreactor metagenome]|uniref:Uncharacterized protein n=1 Tax=bioreactor metagenome TaxID=1076179 RepID=A0A645GMK1_9ZZZZ